MGIYHLLSTTEWKTRDQLVRESGQCDRMVRRELSELGKHSETVIISSSHGEGYKLPSSIEELKRSRNEFKSREDEMHERVEALDEAIRKWKTKQADEQLSFDF